MNKVFDGIRRGDIVLAALMTALGVLLMVGNISSTDPEIRIDSQSWLMIPLFAAVTAPILWRRRNILAVCAVTAAALAVHILAFGWVVRCGAGLPLAFALAYAVGRLTDRRQSWAGLAAVIGIQFLVLVQDSAAGLEIIPVTAVISAAVWGIGAWLRKRPTVIEPATAPAPTGSYV